MNPSQNVPEMFNKRPEASRKTVT